MLSPADAAAFVRGRDLKRCVRAAAALQGLYDDTSLSEATGVNRGAVAAWWDGAQMKPGTLQRIADVTGLAFDELTRYVYLAGPLPRLPTAVDPDRVAAVQAQARDSSYPLLDGDPDNPADTPPSADRPRTSSHGPARPRTPHP